MLEVVCLTLWCSMITIIGIIFDAQDAETVLPRKRLVTLTEASVNATCTDIDYNVPNTPGQLKRALCDVLGISMKGCTVSKRLKSIIEGKP